MSWASERTSKLNDQTEAPQSNRPLTVRNSSLLTKSVVGGVWATELTRAIALDGKCLRDKCEQDHSLGYELVKRFAQIIERRLQATRLQLLDIYGHAPGR